MVKRHVFWRMPTGQPYRGHDAKHAPTALLGRIGRSASVTTEGGIQFAFSSVYFNDRVAVQTAAVVLAPEGEPLNDTDAASIVWKAVESEIRKSGGGKPLSPEHVLLCADRLAASHFRKPVTDYVLITTLSVQQLPAKSIRVNDCTVSSIARRGDRYPLPGTLKSWAHDSPHAKHLETTKYRTIRIRTNGRSPSEATDKALRAVNLLRGLWTLFGTFRSWKIYFSGIPKREPIGLIRTGPIHTLHALDGKLAANTYWYEPDYNGDGEIFTPKHGWDKIEKHRRWTMRRMRRYAYKCDLEELIVRYANALDNVDFNVAFLQICTLGDHRASATRASKSL